MAKQRYKAVVFDIGGVVLSSPLSVIREYSLSLGLPEEYLNVLIADLGQTGAWARFERGELGLFEFYDLWNTELNDLARGKAAYERWAGKRGKKVDVGEMRMRGRVDARELFGRMMRQSATYDPYILQAIDSLRRLDKYRILALTNNYTSAYHSLLSLARSGNTRATSELQHLGWVSGPAPESLRDLFDDFVDSSLAGTRKPEKGIYELLLRRNGLRGEECVFLDDIGENLRTGRELGMRCVRVRVGRTREAVRELEGILGERLLDDNDGLLERESADGGSCEMPHGRAKARL